MVLGMASGQGKFGAGLALALAAAVMAGWWVGGENRARQGIAGHPPADQPAAIGARSVAPVESAPRISEQGPAGVPVLPATGRQKMGPFAPPQYNKTAPQAAPPLARGAAPVTAPARDPDVPPGGTPGPHPPGWARHAAAAAPNPGGLPVIAIVIDDVGIVPARAAAALALPGPITLAVLPYAPDAARIGRKARALGHEVLVHLPMEAGNGADPGPQALLAALPPEEFSRRLHWNLTRMDGMIGVNNHMGSKLTRNPAAMNIVLAELKRRGLMFLDSRTAGQTVAAATARSLGVTALERDVFLDNVVTDAAIRQQLQKAENTARLNGHAIAIGHPHPATIAALLEWAPGLEARGLRLAPLSALTLLPANIPGKRLVSLPLPGG